MSDLAVPDFTELRNLSTMIADHLAGMIQGGELAPGEHLVQLELAHRFGVSRGAVRDALQHLRQRGLAINVPRKGTIVRPLSCKAVRDVFAVRRAVEGLAARIACKRITDRVLERLDQIVTEQEILAAARDAHRLLEKDWEFHSTIYELSDNEPLIEMIEQLWSRTRQARGLALAELAWAQEWGKHSATRHRSIMEALRRRDSSTAEERVVETIRVAEEELVEALQASGWGDRDDSPGTAP